MAIGPDCQEAMHVGMASFPHPASSRARLSAPTINQACHLPMSRKAASTAQPAHCGESEFAPEPVRSLDAAGPACLTDEVE
jgi:hypothetical protein